MSIFNSETSDDSNERLAEVTEETNEVEDGIYQSLLLDRVIPLSSSAPQENDDPSDLGADLGKRIAKLELQSKLNKHEMEKIAQRCQVAEEVLSLEDDKIEEVEKKLASVESKLAFTEKQGFENETKLKNVERDLENKQNELALMRLALEKKDEQIFKMEKENKNTLSRFLTLLQTCETFQKDLETLKRSNADMKTELKSIKGQTKISAPPKIDGKKDKPTFVLNSGESKSKVSIEDKDKVPIMSKTPPVRPWVDTLSKQQVSSATTGSVINLMNPSFKIKTEQKKTTTQPDTSSSPRPTIQTPPFAPYSSPPLTTSVPGMLLNPSVPSSGTVSDNVYVHNPATTTTNTTSQQEVTGFVEDSSLFYGAPGYMTGYPPGQMAVMYQEFYPGQGVQMESFDYQNQMNQYYGYPPQPNM